MIIECARIFPRWRGSDLLYFEDLAACEDSDHHGRNLEEAKRTPVLLDIVGARGLRNEGALGWKDRSSVDPYCVVSVSGEEVHQTKVARNDSDPIWTVETSSLCLLNLRDGDEVAVQLWHGSRPLYEKVTLKFPEEIAVTNTISASGIERREFPLAHPPPVAAKPATSNSDDRITVAIAPKSGRQSTSKATLALQYRLATPQDVALLDWLHKKERSGNASSSSPPPLALDINFAREAAMSNMSLVRRQKTVRSLNSNQHDLLLRVQPGPDPQRRKETEWMTSDEIREQSFKPSTVWTSTAAGAGGGVQDEAVGVLHLEILACDHLPSLDLTGKSDVFCALLFENSLLRTDVIWDCHCPRWMPWATRAYSLSVRHPASLLFLGAFDYDAAPLDSAVFNAHDPIGRVVLHPSRFEPEVTHVLTYRLSLDEPNESTENHPGAASPTVTIRLRVQWHGGQVVPPVAIRAPPSFVLHVETDRSYRVVRYLTRGSVDMQQASLSSVRTYVDELYSYIGAYCYSLDVLFEIFLWRGRARFLGVSVWFPVHSLVLFTILCLCLEYPHKAPAFALYGVCWILMSTQYYASRHPNPWKRVKALDQRLRSYVLGDASSSTIIPPQAGVDEERRIERLDAVKAQRMSRLIHRSLMFGLSVYRIYSKSSSVPVIVTERKDWSLLSDRLYYAHLLLQYFCTYLRAFRNFLHWKGGSSTQRFAGKCLVLATIWMLLPVQRVAHWMLRLWVWIFFGPWMKLVDVRWVQHWYRTKDQLLQDIDSGCGSKDVASKERDLPDFDACLESDLLLGMGHRGRLVAEQARKERAWRHVLLGTYSERVPVVDSSRFPSTPLPSSFSQVEAVEAAVETIVYTPGQEVSGSMIPTVAFAP
jgi:hypothetical protein